jgi:hypothetical protein
VIVTGRLFVSGRVIEGGQSRIPRIGSPGDEGEM